MNAAVRDLVRQRARYLCEYCRMPQAHCSIGHHIEHVVARQHGGGDEPDNLALACQQCNLSKGPNLSGIDPETGVTVELFHPRRQNWREHFEFEGALIKGRTSTGRATVQVLGFNAAERIEKRGASLALLRLEGLER